MAFFNKFLVAAKKTCFTKCSSLAMKDLKADCTKDSHDHKPTVNTLH